MPLKIVRNDITKMNTEAIVNTANENPVVGTGCDLAIYQAAGYEDLLRYRREHIGHVPEGGAFLTPGFQLPAKYIIHAVSPAYRNDAEQQEKKLRECYRKSLRLAEDHQIRSIAFPVIATGGFGFPKEEGIRIAVDEIHAFLSDHDMLIYLVVFGQQAADIGKKLYPDLETYIDRNYEELRYRMEYREQSRRPAGIPPAPYDSFAETAVLENAADSCRQTAKRRGSIFKRKKDREAESPVQDAAKMQAPVPLASFDEAHENKLEERMRHLTDTFSEYLLYLIKTKNMENAEVYKRGIVDKKTFSKIKNHPDYHPQKMTALCLCVGAKLNLDESRDLLARAGYALSPCDKTDIIFSYFIENEIYDMIELDIQLEEHGLPCIIS